MFLQGKKLTENDMKKKSYEELHKIYMDLAHIIMPKYDESDSKRISPFINAYGCKTWGEAREYFDLLAAVMNQMNKGK